MSFTKGHTINVGRKRSPETKERMRNAVNSGRFQKGSSGFTKKHTEESKEKMKKTWFKKGITPWNKGIVYKRGEEHWNWSGGISIINKRERNNAMQRVEYKNWRRAVLERDNHTCVICGDYQSQLNADHIKPWFKYPDLRYEINNGRTLCVDCHKKTETYGNRKTI